MNHSFDVKGIAAEIRWSYHRAASLGAWTMTVGGGETTVTAAVLSSDAFKVSQQPLTFVVSRPNGVTWRFPVRVLQIAGDSLTGTLGPQE